MRQSLASGTAALPFAAHNQPPHLANATVNAIDSGTLLAAAGLIEAAMRRYAADYRLLLCGGDAPLLAQVIDCPAVIDMDLVLKGLLIATKE
jgi:type III pantothenate kinase